MNDLDFLLKYPWYFDNGIIKPEFKLLALEDYNKFKEEQEFNYRDYGSAGYNFYKRWLKDILNQVVSLEKLKESLTDRNEISTINKEIEYLYNKAEHIPKSAVSITKKQYPASLSGLINSIVNPDEYIIDYANGSILQGENGLFHDLDSNLHDPNTIPGYIMQNIIPGLLIGYGASSIPKLFLKTLYTKTIPNFITKTIPKYFGTWAAAKKTMAPFATNLVLGTVGGAGVDAVSYIGSKKSFGNFIGDHIEWPSQIAEFANPGYMFTLGTVRLIPRYFKAFNKNLLLLSQFNSEIEAKRKLFKYALYIQNKLLSSPIQNITKDTRGQAATLTRSAKLGLLTPHHKVNIRALLNKWGVDTFKNLQVSIPRYGTNIMEGVLQQPLFTINGINLVPIDSKVQEIINNNIEFLRKILPEAVPFGSAVLYRNGISKVPSDLDVYITREALEKALKRPEVAQRISRKVHNPEDRLLFWGGQNPSTEFTHDNPFAIDLNIINATGFGNARALQLYRQFFPAEYRQQLQSRVVGNNPIQLTDLSGNPLTSQLLLDAYDPIVGSILDILETNKIGKIGRKMRILLTPGLEDATSKALRLYSIMTYGPNGKVLPTLDFSKGFPTLIGIDFPLDNSSKEALLNIMNYWYLLGEGGLFRAVNMGNIGDDPFSGDINTIMRNLTTWNPKAGGGSMSGFGLNTTYGTSSGHRRAINGWIQPKIEGITEGMSALDAYNIISRSMGLSTYQFTPEELKIIRDILKKYNIHTHLFSNPTQMVYELPRNTQEIAEAVKEIGTLLGIPVFQGDIYYTTKYGAGLVPFTNTNSSINFTVGDRPFLLPLHNGIFPYSGPSSFLDEIDTASIRGLHNKTMQLRSRELGNKASSILEVPALDLLSNNPMFKNYQAFLPSSLRKIPPTAFEQVVVPNNPLDNTFTNLPVEYFITQTSSPHFIREYPWIFTDLPGSPALKLPNYQKPSTLPEFSDPKKIYQNFIDNVKGVSNLLK